MVFFHVPRADCLRSQWPGRPWKTWQIWKDSFFRKLRAHSGFALTRHIVFVVKSRPVESEPRFLECSERKVFIKKAGWHCWTLSVPHVSSCKARGRPQRTHQLKHACVGSLVPMVTNHFPWSRTGLWTCRLCVEEKSINEFDMRRQAVMVAAAAADDFGKSSEELVSEVSTANDPKAIWWRVRDDLNASCFLLMKRVFTCGNMWKWHVFSSGWWCQHNWVYLQDKWTTWTLHFYSMVVNWKYGCNFGEWTESQHKVQRHLTASKSCHVLTKTHIILDEILGWILGQYSSLLLTSGLDTLSRFGC